MALNIRSGNRLCCSLWQKSGLRWIHATTSLSTMKPVSPQEHQILKEQFWDKNKRLQRPISPHLTIYKPQMTSMLSITHRGTGLAQSVILSAAGIFAIVSSSPFPQALAWVQSFGFGGALIFLGKFAIAWPVCYHLFNGCRHLAWDMGYGFKMPDLYKTGWTVLALSVVAGLALSMM